MLRWGILSSARIGIEQVIPAIQNSTNGEIVALASRDGEKARAVASRFNIAASFAGYEELLACEEVDAVYIPLPTSQHVEWAIKAADAGKHVLCEKPIALNADQIDNIIAARDRNKVLISEAFMVTYHPQWHKVRQLLTEGAIGTLKHVQGVFTYFNKDADNMRNIIELGGGALPDIGVYPTVTTRFVTGLEPQKVSAKVEYDQEFGTDFFASCRIDFGDFELSMMVSTQLALRQEMSFHGDKGWIELSAPFNAGLYDADSVTLHDVDHNQIQQFRYPGVNQYCLQVEAFGRAASGEGTPGTSELFSLENSKSNQKLIDAIYQAGRTGNWESV